MIKNNQVHLTLQRNFQA